MGYGTPWTPEEDDLIKMYFPLHGGSWKEWAYIMPHRSDKSIMMRASRLGIRSDYRRHGGEGITRAESDAMRDMENGLPPSRIDERRFWVRGRAHDLVVSAWAKGYLCA